VVELRIGDDCFRAEIGQGTFSVTRNGSERADATLVTDAATFRTVVFGGRPMAEAVRGGGLRIDGDRRVAARFARCFPRPAIAAGDDGDTSGV
jgi:putative sterol carrier protein